MLTAIGAKQYDQAITLLTHTEKRFDKKLVKEMILATQCAETNALSYAMGTGHFSLIFSILDYLKDENIRELINKKNSCGCSPLEEANHHSQKTDNALGLICLCFQETYNMSLEAVCKELFGRHCWEGYFKDLKTWQDEPKANS